MSHKKTEPTRKDKANMVQALKDEAKYTEEIYGMESSEETECSNEIGGCQNKTESECGRMEDCQNCQDMESADEIADYLNNSGTGYDKSDDYIADNMECGCSCESECDESCDCGCQDENLKDKEKEKMNKYGKSQTECGNMNCKDMESGDMDEYYENMQCSNESMRNTEAAEEFEILKKYKEKQKNNKN